MTTEAPPKLNVYAQRCHSCGAMVEALEGRLERAAGGVHWLCYHLPGHCAEPTWFRFAHPFNQRPAHL